MRYEEYDPTHVYSTGDVCIRLGSLYRRNDVDSLNPVAEAWDATHWDELTVADALNLKQDDIGETNIPSGTPDTTKTFYIGSANLAKLSAAEIAVALPNLDPIP